jgi:hypothetical protein
MNKNGQITIFIIVAILLVVVIFLLFTLYNGPIKTYTQKQALEPDQHISECIKNAVGKDSDIVINNSGYIKTPQLVKAFGYQDKIPYRNYTYLCYTPNFRAKCIPQEPAILEHVNEELTNDLNEEINNCFSELKINLESQGYIVNLGKEMNFSIDIISGSVRATVYRNVNIQKAEQKKTFNKFISTTRTPLYELISVSQEIIRQEALYCNSEYLEIMREKTEIQIEKFQTGDDVRIYSVKDLPTEKIMRFAIRGCVLPAPA